MSNLKPCPFCGGEAELCYGPGLGTDSCRGYTLYAGCNECGAKSPGLWQEKKPKPNDQSWKDAADEWNHRPGEPDPENCGAAYCEHHPEGLPVCGMMKGKSMSKTPRTDAQLKLEAFFDGIGIVETVEVEFARELEEELIEARARIDHLERVVDEMQNEQALICAEGQSITELVAAKDKQLAEAQVEIEKQDTLLEKCLSLLKQQKEKEEL